MADLGWASTGLGPLGGGHKSGGVMADFGGQHGPVSVLQGDFGNQFGVMGMGAGGFGMHGNGLDGAGRQGLMGGMMAGDGRHHGRDDALLLSGMMPVRVGGQGGGARMDYAGLGAAGAGMGGFAGGGMLHGTGPMGGPGHAHVGMGGLMGSNGMRGGGMGGIKGGMGRGGNGFLLSPLDALSHESLAAAGMGHDPAMDVSPPARQGCRKRVEPSVCGC